MSWLRVCLSAEGAKNVSWPWLSPLRGWGSLTMALTGKFVYIYIYTRLNLRTKISIFKSFVHLQHMLQAFINSKIFQGDSLSRNDFIGTSRQEFLLYNH